jgi:hypothetical protein
MIHQQRLGKLLVANNARSQHTSSVLTNGKVLVIGGFYNDAQNSTELYDPSTEPWTSVSSMNSVRGEDTAAVLTNGKVLVTGGSHGGIGLNGAELYSSYQTK